ncbi:MAG: GntR family transcriptional regulator [Chloroflexi bacterium]|nr:GntR family transcriptional regulator [Chloroflexota bacterium]
MARLKRNNPIPLYIQLYETLRREIQADRLKPDEQLPSERELCERYEVSRMTVRQALVDLGREGLVYSRVGKGTFVSKPKIDQQLRTLTGFSLEMTSRGSAPSSRVLEARLQPSDAGQANMLHIPAGSEIVILGRVRLADGLPLAVETVYLPHHLCPNLLRHDFAVTSLYEVLEREYSFRLTRAEQTIEAALANSRDIGLLQLIPPAPVLVMERLTFTDQDVLIEYVQSTYRGDRYKFRAALAPRQNGWMAQ